MPRPTEAAQLSLPIILYSALWAVGQETVLSAGSESVYKKGNWFPVITCAWCEHQG